MTRDNRRIANREDMDGFANEGQASKKSDGGDEKTRASPSPVPYPLPGGFTNGEPMHQLYLCFANLRMMLRAKCSLISL